jgi:hypothetical protein
MHYLSSVYSVTIPLHVSGLLVAHHQEVWARRQQLRRTTRTNCHIYTLLPPDDGLNKLKINSALSWFHYTQVTTKLTNLLQLTI